MNDATRFQQDGFVTVERFLDDRERAEVEQALTYFIEKVVPRTSPGHVVYETGSDKKISHLSSLDQYEPYWKDLLARPRTIKLLEACLGTAVEPLACEVFYKPARVGSAAPPHQDNAYLHFNPPDAMAVWVALDEANRDNGCVCYAQGSHKFGAMPHLQGDKPPFSKMIEDAGCFSQYPQVPAQLRPGDAVIHHVLAVHWSGPNQTDHDRRGLVLNYKGVNARVDQQAHGSHMAFVEKLRSQSSQVS